VGTEPALLSMEWALLVGHRNTKKELKFPRAMRGWGLDLGPFSNALGPMLFNQ